MDSVSRWLKDHEYCTHNHDSLIIKDPNPSSIPSLNLSGSQMGILLTAGEFLVLLIPDMPGHSPLGLRLTVFTLGSFTCFVNLSEPFIPGRVSLPLNSPVPYPSSELFS